MSQLTKSVVSGIQKYLVEEQHIPQVRVTGVLDAATQEGYQYFLQSQGIGYPHYTWFPETYEQLHQAMKDYLNKEKVDITSDEVLKDEDDDLNLTLDLEGSGEDEDADDTLNLSDLDVEHDMFAQTQEIVIDEDNSENADGESDEASE